MYLHPEPVPVKTFLTVEEEEDLIRRLYIYPRLNLFPTKLYEDLPPLKFWNNPASVIETYLQRKVFQKRLQLAYEFNQSKENHDHVSYDATEDSPEKLTKAVIQLTEDINHFSYLTQQQYFGETIKLQGSDDRNKDLWDQIRPEEIVTPPQENMITEDMNKSTNKPTITLRDDIIKRISDYKNIYKLKNIGSDDKPPLALTIDIIPRISEESFSEEETVLIKPSTSPDQHFYQSQEFSEYSSEKTADYTSKLPSLQSVSENNVQNTVKLEQILKKVPPVNDDLDSLLPRLPLLDSTKTNYNRRGTLITVRDSVELAHRKMSSRYSRFSLTSDLSDFRDNPHPHAPMARDSYVMLADKLPKVHHGSLTESVNTNEDHYEALSHNYKMSLPAGKKHHKSTIVGHQDSLLLAFRKVSSKAKLRNDLDCDLCNIKESKSIHFLCEFHASTTSSTQKTSLSTMSSSKPCLASRDSVILAKKRVSLKHSRKSIGCQINEENIQEGTPQFNDVEEKGSKMSKQIEKSIKNENPKKSPSKLKNYLMSAVQINHVITQNDSSSRK